MKRFTLALILLLIAVTGAQAANLITNNAGFDATGPVTADFSGADVVTTTTVPGWRLIGLGASGGVTGDFQVIAEPSAPSQPNVLQINPASGDFGWIWVDGDTAQPLALTGGKAYRMTFFARQVGTEAQHLVARVYPGSMGQVGFWLTNDWVKYTINFTPAVSGNSWPELLPYFYNGTKIQLDSVAIEEVDLSKDNLIPNGDFEDSSASPSSWSVYKAPTSSDFAATIVTTGAANGSNACKLSQTAAGGHDFATENADFDGAIFTGAINFTGGHKMYLGYSIKAGTASKVWVRVTLSNSTGAFQQIDKYEIATAAWTRKEYQIDIPAEAVSFRVNVRLVDDAGKYVGGDAFIDNFVAGDMTAGFNPNATPIPTATATATQVPVNLSGFSLE